jgi:cell filamentation protein
MASKPGEVMGYLAYGHPFLDGNGRTIMTVHAELAQRAGISLDWAATDKMDYLTALTRELDKPGKGHLDAYLKPFIGLAVGHDRLASHVTHTPALMVGRRAPMRSWDGSAIQTCKAAISNSSSGGRLIRSLEHLPQLRFRVFTRSARIFGPTGAASSCFIFFKGRFKFPAAVKNTINYHGIG